MKRTHRFKVTLMVGLLVAWHLLWTSNQLTTREHSLIRMDQHCVFVVQKLWGQHDDLRSNATLHWYRSVTLPSIQAAAAHVPYPVTVLLFGQHVYENHPLLLEMDKDTDMLVRSNHQLRVERSIQTNRCGVVSFTRLDGDDMLHPQAFHWIVDYWHSKMVHLRQSRHKRERIRKRRQAYCRDSTRRCPFALVTGTTHIATVHWGSHRHNRNASTATTATPCVIHRLPRVNFFSPGLTVTLPTLTWQRYFETDPQLPYLESHDWLLDGVVERLPKWYSVWENRVPDLAVYLVTPLSGHYEPPALAQNCTLEDLTLHLGNKVAQVLWGGRHALPTTLNESQWLQNTFRRNFVS